MKTSKIAALVQVELKRLIRDPMTLFVLLLMPLGLTLVFYFAMGNLYTDPLRPEMSHFDYLIPGAMGYAVVYMGMMISMSLNEYRDAGILKRLAATPASPSQYLGSLILANVLIGVVQGFIVLALAKILGFDAPISIDVLVITIIFLVFLSATAVGFGLLTATFAKNSGAATGLSMIYLLPMMIFGTFLTVFDDATYNIAKFTPNFYLTDSLMRIFFDSASLTEPAIWKNLGILVIISVVVVVGGIQLFKRTEFR